MISILLLVFYIVVISWVAFYFQYKPVYDVIKKNGIWGYSKSFKSGDIISIPIECFIEVFNE